MADKTVIVEVQYDTSQAIKNIENYTAAIEGAKVEQAGLKAQLEAGTISQKDYAIAVEQSKNGQSKANAERKATIQLLDSEKGSINELRARIKVLTDERNSLNLKTVEGQARLKEINKTLDAHNETIKKSADGYLKQKLNIGNYKDALSSLPGPLGSVVSGIGGMIKAAWEFVANPIGAVIAALVLTVTALYKAFVSTDSGATEMAANMEALKAVSDIFRQKLIGVIDKLKSLTSGIFDNIKSWMAAHPVISKVAGVLAMITNPIVAVVAGVTKLTKSIADSNPEFEQAAKAAKQYAYSLDQIEDSESNYTSKRAENANKIARLEFLAQDKGKAISVRRDALKTALKMSEEEALQEKKFIDQRLNNELEYLAAKSFGVNKVSKEEIKAFLLMSDEEQANASAGLKFIRNNNEAKFKDLEDLYAKSINADTKYFEENKRNLSRLTGFEEQIQKERQDKIKKQNDDKLKAIEDAQKKEISLIKFNHDSGKISDNEYYKQIATFRDKYFKEGTEQWQQYSLEIIKFEQKNAEEKKKIDEEEAKRRGEAIWKLAELKNKELELEAKTIQAKRDAQIKAADDEKARALEAEGLLNEEKEVIEAEHKARLIEIETDYQEQIRAQRQQALDEALAGMQQIIAASQEMSDKRVSIGLDAFSKLTTINWDEVKTSSDAFLAIGQAAQGLTSLITANHEKESASLQAQKAKELAAVEGNKEATDEVNKKFAKKEQQLKKKQFENDKKKALVDTEIATALAVVKGLASGLPMPGLLMAALAAVAGGVSLAAIASKQYTPTESFSKGGIIGGLSHAQGGTQFIGSDGSRFEAEKGEAMFVLKKDATAEIAALSAINESHGGRSFTRGASHLQDGGEVSPVGIERSIDEAIQRTPIFVRVGDIQTGLTDVEQSKKAGVI